VQFGLRIHHERTVLRDRLVQRCAGHQYQPRGLTGMHAQTIGLRTIGQDCHASRCHFLVTYLCRTAIGEDESVVAGRHGLLEAGACRQVDVQIQRRHGRCTAPSTPWLRPAITFTATPSGVV
jgi:hypothetical protein